MNSMKLCNHYENYKYIFRMGKVFQRHFVDDANSEKPNLYGTLGVNTSASHAEIKQAYYDLTFKYHPDRNEGSEEAAIKFRDVTEAYEVLGNYGMRKRYDKGLPLPVSVRVPVEKKDIIEPNVKYQKFFDSRSRPQSTSNENDIEDERRDAQKTSDRLEAAAKRFEESYVLQLPAAVFLVVIILLVRFKDYL
ncbi:chaperone protein DnaJ-like [Stegodyphus dumicola]|uniref:chaperone protein DnaJ-like n=1 Tax=Stegodyphus dumicola TaxID=202533 RepID=UPI0015A93E82|nr:chaperone protein DnaJ-like [Stegodyphus dumicola]